MQSNMQEQGCSFFLGRMLGAVAALLLYIAVPLIIIVIVILIYNLLR